MPIEKGWRAQDAPNNQNEMKTGVRPLTRAFKRARYSAHDDAGDPGSGSRRPEDDGDRDMAAVGVVKPMSISRKHAARKRSRGEKGEKQVAEGVSRRRFEIRILPGGERAKVQCTRC
jgi:hypothetical protein